MKTITIEDDLWKRLTFYKLELGLSTISDTINLIIEDSKDLRRLKEIKSFQYKYKKRKGG